MTRGTINERLITTPINQRREEREQPCPVSRSWEVYIASFEVYGPWTCRTTRKRGEPPPETTRGIVQAVNRDVFADIEQVVIDGALDVVHVPASFSWTAILSWQMVYSDPFYRQPPRLSLST